MPADSESSVPSVLDVPSAPTLARIDWADPRGVALREAMDVEMGALYADRFAAMPSEQIAPMQAAFVIDPAEVVASVIALVGDTAVGHAALRPYGDSLEVKRVFVDPAFRGRGVSQLLMREMEVIAQSMGVTSLILQTANLQLDAMRLYDRLGYLLIPAFRGYEVVPGCLCYGKTIELAHPWM